MMKKSVKTSKDDPTPHLKISKEQIQSLPLGSYDGPVELVQNEKSLLQVLKELKKEKVLGFDTESRPSFKKGVSYPISLIQLASAKKVFLIQIGKLEKLDLLKEIWENEKILKVGIAIRDDIRKLIHLHNFQVTGFIDISELTKKIGVQNTGLRPLVGMFFGIRISKAAQTSNWAQETLTPTQLAYAATDAWMSRELYLHLKKLIEEKELE